MNLKDYTVFMTALMLVNMGLTYFNGQTYTVVFLAGIFTSLLWIVGLLTRIAYSQQNKEQRLNGKR